MRATTIWATRCRRSWTRRRAAAEGELAGRRRAASRCCRWTREAKELPAWLGRPHVVVALELDEMLGREGLIESLSFYHGDIDVISPLKGLPINNTRVSHFFSRDILSLRIHNNLARPWPQLVKRALRPRGGLARCCCSWRPLLALVAAKIRLVDGGAGDLRPHPGRPARAAVPVLQVPHHGARTRPRCWPSCWRATRRRGRSGPRTASSARPADHAARPLSAQDQPRRAAAALQRGARRDEPGRPAAGGARRARALRRGPGSTICRSRPA